VDLLKSFAEEMLLCPVNSVIRGDSIVDKLEESICEASASTEKSALH